MDEKRRPLAAVVALLLLATPAVGRNLYGANSSCGQKTFVTPEGTISSPGYPQPYPDRVSCTWKIVTAPGTVLSVNINDLDIEGDGSSCGRSWLSVSVDAGGRAEKLCGRRPRPVALSLRQRLTVVKFLASSANGGRHRGFALSYSVGCGRPDALPCDAAASACYARRQRCDGAPDCPGGEDERDCPSCGEDEFPCADGLSCYRRSQLCDRRRHCADLSDETGCPGRCGHAEGLAPCGGEGCFRPATDLCDGRFDCPGGEDELGCDPLCPRGFNCSGGGGCYAPERRCDGVRDCPGGDDELCFREERFRCDNRLRVPRYLVCNGVDNCGDGSDERSCLKTSVITAAIVGSLLCGLLLVLAVGCTCRLYGLRVANAAALRVYLEPPRAPELLTREPPPAYHVAVAAGCPLQRLPPPPPAPSQQGAPSRRASRRPSNRRRGGGGRLPTAAPGEGAPRRPPPSQPQGAKRTTDAAPDEDDGESSRCPASSPSSSSESPSRDSVTSSSFLSGDDDVPLLV